MRDIRIDEPGAGQWVMDRVGGAFNHAVDHSFTSHDGDHIIGGFALSHYTGASMSVHMAGEDKHWCSKDLLWLVFHYAFVQLGCIKLLAPVRSDNFSAISMDLRAGWHLETVIRDVYEHGVHMLVLTMTEKTCPWLAHEPKAWRANNRRAA